MHYTDEDKETPHSPNVVNSFAYRLWLDEHRVTMSRLDLVKTALGSESQQNLRGTKPYQR